MAQTDTIITSVIIYGCWGCVPSPAHAYLTGRDLGFYWHLPPSVSFLEGSLTHQARQQTWTAFWHFQKYGIRALGTHLHGCCTVIFSHCVAAAAQELSPSPEELRGSSRLAEHQCWKCIFSNPEQQQAQPARETEVSSVPAWLENCKWA